MPAAIGAAPIPTEVSDDNRNAVEPGPGELRLHSAQISTARLVFYTWVAALSLFYVIVRANTPIAIFVHAAHDDGYYMKFGQLIAEGHWLGPYDEFTLMKGPGYPLFLALANWLGLSVTVAQALFHCVAVIFFSTICCRFMGSYLAAAALVALLLWEPMNYTTHLLRVLRDGVYADQVLIVLGASVWTFFGASTARERIFYAALSGAVLGWLWLTREESVWVVPGFLLLGLAALVVAVGQHRWRQIFLSISIIAAAWGAIQVGYRTINLVVYKSFAGVDTSERNYKRALSALHSVRSGGTRPFVSVTKEARKYIYPVSPTFATLAPYIEGSGGKTWEGHSCPPMPASCGEIGAGWFAFMLREASAKNGNYSSPAQASAFYGRIADEITAACARGALMCKPRLIAELPNAGPSQWTRIPETLWRALAHILQSSRGLDAFPSVGVEPAWSTTLRFLHYPLHSKSQNIPDHFVMRGWYRKSGTDWFSITLKDANAGEDVQLVRSESPDLVTYFGDPDASHQRYTANISCSQDCTLRLTSGNENAVERRISEMLNTRGPIGLGGGIFYIDDFNSTDPAARPSPIQSIATAIRSKARDTYDVIGGPVLITGLVAFLATAFLARRRAMGNLCFIFALVAWVLAGSRILLMVLIDAMMMAALTYQYLTPANLLVWSAAVLSWAAAFQCLWPRKRRLKAKHIETQS
jgi:hypothetical protein